LKPGHHIDYKSLRKVNHEAARIAVLEYLKSNGGNISEASRTFGINRCVVYDILRKQVEGDLSDRSKVPKHQPNKTAPKIETLVIEIKNKTHFGPQRLSIYLAKYHDTRIPSGTIRHILRRNRDQLSYQKRYRRAEKRPKVDWYSAKPFEIVQIDLKHIRDKKALTKEQLIHLDQFDIPNYQWSALDVNSRYKLIGYSREKSWTNGLCWYLWVISFLRAHGVSCKIVFTVDNGEEFGGKSWMKVKELKKLISAFDCKLIQNHKGHCEENAHVERSHRTDDDEFYCLRAQKFNSERDLIFEASGYIYYYNNLREHSSLGYKTPIKHLKQYIPDFDDGLQFIQPIMLDKAAVLLGPWSGYNLLAQHQRIH
jgi:transposase